MKAVGYTVTFLVAMSLSSVINGYGLSIIWSWFMVTTFGLPELTIPAAIGVSLVVSFLTYTGNEKADSKDVLVLLGDMLAKVLGKTLVIILVGWIVVQFM